MPAPAAVFRTYSPCAELHPYICGYMWFTLEGEEPQRTVHHFLHDGRSETRFHSADPLLTRMLPGAYLGLTFNFGDPWKIHSEARDALTLRTSWVMGATTRPGRMEFGRRAEALGVMFHAGQAPMFLKASAESLTDRIAALDALWGPAARALEARLAELPTVVGKIRALEKELLRRLRAVRHVDLGMRPIAGLIEREHGDVSVAWLSEASGVSRQHLTRRFRQQIGVSPKQFCRYTRFHALVTRAVLSPQVEWAALAAEFGYYDQAHLIAEFKEFTGLTPSQFFRPPAAVSAAPAVAAD